MNKVFDPYADPNTPACTCADWGMTGCHSNCAREIYIRKKQMELDHVRSHENHADSLDSGGTVHCVVESDGAEEGRPFIVREGASGTSSDVPPTGASPADSKQISGASYSSQPVTEAGIFVDPGDGFSEGIIVERILFNKPIAVKNGETVSINRGTFEVSVNDVVVGTCFSDIIPNGFDESTIKGTLAGSGSNFQNIKRAFKEFKPLEIFAVDYASFDIGAYNTANEWRKHPAHTLLPLTAEDVKLGTSEDAKRRADCFAEVLNSLVPICREFLATLGTHRRECFLQNILRTASPEAAAEFRRLMQADYREYAVKAFRAMYQGAFPSWQNFWGNDAVTGRTSGDSKAASEVARIPGSTDESVHYIPRKPEDE